MKIPTVDESGAIHFGNNEDKKYDQLADILTKSLSNVQFEKRRLILMGLMMFGIGYVRSILKDTNGNW